MLKKLINMRWGEILPLIHQARKTTKRSYLDLLNDLYNCYKKGYLWDEYFLYNFHNNKDENYRKTFVSNGIHYPIIKRIFNEDGDDFFNDKGLFNRNFKDLKGINALDLRVDSFGQFKEFLGTNEVFFIKTPFGMGGYEVKKVKREDYKEMTDEKLYNYLIENDYVVVEELIQQHPDVSKLSLNSVNTLRVVTVKNVNGNITVPFVVSRISITDSYKDNASLGGGVCVVSNEGKIKFNYLSQYPKLAEFSSNPYTDFKYYDFEFPYFKDSIELCIKAAKRCECHYIGWDVAISVNGPVLVEANIWPGSTLYQGYNQLENGIGKLSELEEAFGIKLSK